MPDNLPLSKKYFVKNGKALKTAVNACASFYMRQSKETLTSLCENENVTHAKSKKVINPKAYLSYIGSILLFLILATGITFLMPAKLFPEVNNKYVIYSSKPLTINHVSENIGSNDSRGHKINEIFKKYKCPLEGLGDKFVFEADKNGIPWWLVASVSFQESGCGKKTPTVGGEESYNAWGWGVYGGNVHTFDNWARGIETVSEYFNNKFFSKGIVEPCEIMKTYTPPSNGSWCEGVKHFGELIQNFETPNNNL